MFENSHVQPHVQDPNIAEFFRATTGGMFAPLLVLGSQDTERDALDNSFNTL